MWLCKYVKSDVKDIILDNATLCQEEQEVEFLINHYLYLYLLEINKEILFSHITQSTQTVGSIILHFVLSHRLLHSMHSTMPVDILKQLKLPN